MNLKIRKISLADKNEIIEMMKEFYSSEAVHTNGSLEIFEKDFNNCIYENPYLKGYVFDSNSTILGYAMIAKSFSTEYGKYCIWFEDLYIKREYRGNGIIQMFIDYIKQNHPDHIFKLEVEADNAHAIHVYQKKGFAKLPYSEMLAEN